MQNHTRVGRGRPRVVLLFEPCSRAACSRRRAKMTLPQARGANAHLMALTTWCLSCRFAAICGRLQVSAQHEPPCIRKLCCSDVLNSATVRVSVFIPLTHELEAFKASGHSPKVN